MFLIPFIDLSENLEDPKDPISGMGICLPAFLCKEISLSHTICTWMINNSLVSLVIGKGEDIIVDW